MAARVSITEPSGRVIGYGEPNVAVNLIQSANKVLLLSDSTWTRYLEPFKRPFIRSTRTKVVKQFKPDGFDSGFFAAWAGDSYLTGVPCNYSPVGGAYEYPLPSGSFPAGTLWYENRVASWPFADAVIAASGFVPPAEENCATFTGSVLEQSKTAGFRVTLEHWTGTHGDTNNNLQIVVVNDAGTTLGTSATFNTYNATNAIETVTLDITSWSGNYFTVVVRGIGGAASTTGKYFVSLACKIEILSSVATNMYFDCLSYGSEQVTTYLNTNYLSNNAWSLINANNYDAVIIALGINGYASPDEATWRTNYQQLIDKIRGTNSALPICSTTQMPLSTLADMYGSVKTVCDNNSNMLVIDTAKQFPVYSTLQQNFTPAWQTGTYYVLGDMVQHGGKVYQHKVLNPSVSTTAPNIDTTNWNEITTSVNNGTFLVNYTRNRVLGDGAHPHPFGRMVYASLFWSALESCAMFDRGLAIRLSDNIVQQNALRLGGLGL